MSLNPFIQFAQDPVGFLAWVGYLLFLLSLVFVTLAFVWRNLLRVRAEWENDRGRLWTYDPPMSWLLRVAAIPLVLAVDAWALSAVVWLLS